MWNVVLVALSCLVLSCTTLEEKDTMPVREFSADQLLQKLNQNEAAIGSLKALFRANIHGEGVPVSYRVDGVFLYKRPSTIRLKGLSRFGGLVFDFLMDRDRYVLHLPQENQSYSGEIGRERFSGSMGLPVHLILRAMDVVLGKVQEDRDRPIVLEEDGDRYRFDVDVRPTDQDMERPWSVRRVWVDRRHVQVSQIEYLSADGVSILNVEADDFRRARDASPVERTTIVLPYHLEAVDQQEDGVVSLSFQEMVVNLPLAPKEFGLNRF